MSRNLASKPARELRAGRPMASDRNFWGVAVRGMVSLTRSDHPFRVQRVRAPKDGGFN